MLSKHFIFLYVSFCSCLTLLIYFYSSFLCQGQIRPPPRKKSPGSVPNSAGSCLIISVLHCLEKWWLKKSVLNALNNPELILFFIFLVFLMYGFPKNLKRKTVGNKFKDKNCWQERIATNFKAVILSLCFYKTLAFPRLDRDIHCAKVR